LSELVVVPGERHVERLARQGTRAETRTALRERLLAALVPDVRFVEPREARVALATALATALSTGSAHTRSRQLDLFAAPAQGRPIDPLIDGMRRRGGASWVRAVGALDDAIAFLRARGADAAFLERVAARAAGVSAARARTLALAMRALDDALATSGARDGRRAGLDLAAAIVDCPREHVAEVAGATKLRARWILSWDPSEVAWWRALDDALAPAGGFAKIVLPRFDRPLDGERERDPLDVLADDLARVLDASLETEPIPAVLGDLAGEPPSVAEMARVRIAACADPVAQARVAVAAVEEALRAGASVERIAIARTVLDDHATPIRRALEDAGLVAFEARGPSPATAPAVATVLAAYEAATSLDRAAVALVLASGYIDASRALEIERHEGHEVVARIARRLESSPTATGPDAAARLVATAAPEGGVDADVARAVVAVFVRANVARTRAERIAAMRAIVDTLGIAARAGRGGLAAFVSDEAPVGIARAERAGIARDARALDAFAAALDLYEAVAHRGGASDDAIDAGVFRAEIEAVLDAAAFAPPAGRAAALRLVRLADVAGDDLDLLVVVDANEGVLPRETAHDPLVSAALVEALARTAAKSSKSFVPLAPGALRARDLAALAVAAADAGEVLLCHLREDATGAAAAPAAVIDVLERAGAAAFAGVPAVAPAGPVLTDIVARAERERAREAFFLDPRREASDVVGDLGRAPPAVRALLLRETGGTEDALAITNLERFARCPFMGYAHAILAAREADLKTELPDAREEGNLGHEALAAAFSAARSLFAARPRDGLHILQVGLRAADEALARAAGHAPLRAITILRVRDGVRIVLGRAIEEEEWDFAFAEQPFGGRRSGAWPPLELQEVEDDVVTRLALRGSIDRIDRAHTGGAARVIDYKRSKNTVRAASSGLGQTALQVPLYSCVASRKLGVPAIGLYLATSPRDLVEGAHKAQSPRARDRMAELVARPQPHALAEVERRALAVVRAARRGRLAPVPADESECRTCAASGGCRKPRFAMMPDEENEEEQP